MTNSWMIEGDRDGRTTTARSIIELASEDDEHCSEPHAEADDVAGGTFVQRTDFDSEVDGGGDFAGAVASRCKVLASHRRAIVGEPFGEP